MKNLVVLFLMLACSSVQAGSRLELGAGLAASSFSTTPDTPGLKGHSGLTASARLDVDLGGVFSLEPGIGYVPKGFSVPGFDQVVHYLDFPVMVKARLPKLGTLTPFVAVGPGIAYELTTYASILAGMLIVKDFDMTMNAAAGVEASIISGIPAFVRVGYSMGLGNVVDQDSHPGAEAKTRALLITTGVSVPLPF
jgi:hypothetical protein